MLENVTRFRGNVDLFRDLIKLVSSVLCRGRLGIVWRANSLPIFLGRGRGG